MEVRRGLTEWPQLSRGQRVTIPQFPQFVGRTTVETAMTFLTQMHYTCICTPRQSRVVEAVCRGRVPSLTQIWLIVGAGKPDGPGNY